MNTERLFNLVTMFLFSALLVLGRLVVLFQSLELMDKPVETLGYTPFEIENPICIMLFVLDERKNNEQLA